MSNTRYTCKLVSSSMSNNANVSYRVAKNEDFAAITDFYFDVFLKGETWIDVKAAVF